MIVNYLKKSGLAVCLVLLLSVMLLCGFTFTEAHAARKPAAIAIRLGAKIPKYATGIDNGIHADSDTKENPIAHYIFNYESRVSSLVINFAKYKPYGVIYNDEQDAVYYNGERVRLFVDFQAAKEPGTDYAFDLCFRDGDGTLCLEAVEDGKGSLVGIKRLDENIALDLL